MDPRPHTSSSSTTPVLTQPPPPLQEQPKFSRYRSVRKAAEAQAIQNAATQSSPTPSSPPPLPSSSKIGSPPPFSKTQNESIKRSMSRYRHAKPGATKAAHSVPPPPPLPAAVTLPTRPHTEGDCIQDLEAREQHEITPNKQQGAGSTRGQDRSDTAPTSYASCSQGAVLPTSQSNDTKGSHRVGLMNNGAEDAKPPTGYFSQERHSSMSSMEDSRPRRSRTHTDPKRANVRSPTSESHNNPAAPSRLLPVLEPKMLDIQDEVQNITNEELAANERAAAAHNGPKSKPQLGKGKGKGGGFLSRMKALDPISSSKLNNNSSGGGSNSHNNNREKLKTLISSPQPISPDEVKVASGNEAPISAVNAGERKVLVTCNDSFIFLPFTPTTQAQDLLYSAANCLSENIEPQSSILLESFKQLGLERPLRKYEHVRDVMNSWDSDSQNHLIVSRLPDQREREGLDVKLAPRKQPSESVFHLYHSQRPGKWEKRWVTLRSDGQVTVAKKQGGESTNICHLSDFDIYSPTSREIAKKVKAPERICFAVKSQQKSIMFLTTENFVHYFATNDEQIGLGWYKAVQQWRSWYLVNVLGEGDKKEKESIGSNAKSPRSGAQKTRSRQGSDASIPYQLGTFKPLLDMDISTWKIERIDNIQEEAPKEPSISKAASVHGRSTRPQKRPFTSAKKSKKKPLTTESDPDTFISSGLLGKTYTQRKKALEEREKDTSQAFTGLGLLRNLATESPTSPSDHSSRRSSRDYTAPQIPTSPKGSVNGCPFSRSKSIKQKPKPLVDLTPVLQEPPQHARKGRGVAVEHGQPLVEAATSPEVLPGAIVIPSATTWRKPVQPPATSHGSHPNIARGGGGGTIHHTRPTTSHSTTARRRERAATVNGCYNESIPPLPIPVPMLPENLQCQSHAVTHASPFAPTGLLARAATTTARPPGRYPHHNNPHDTGRGVATGDRNNFAKPMVDLSQDSQFVEGSLLRGVEAGEIVGKGPIASEQR
ncbi:hypothetical protein ACJ73_05879 [Blastomyces percursus]|uniref:PH domain-containing protein n=1 Tax=Blastomyces percursus TaxID=1658174 RepID=A0A1J9R2P9_9EURO|nr:hypothetical protein ACJ73_05879 [Blastomyces percursus]